MTKNPVVRLLIVVAAFVVLGLLLRAGSRHFSTGEPTTAMSNSILFLELDGVIINGKKFLAQMKKYSEDKNVKAVVISIDSPGGAVGPSQEINNAILHLREKQNLPVVCYTTGLMASGAYYSAVACDKIIVSAGSLVGSIGVIMEFANLEKLYDWAKISRYSITTGKYKDSGAEYRPMREDERNLFQDLINDVYGQFKEAVLKGRPKLDKKVLEEHADGRVFTGRKAVELGFADEVGGYDEAIKAAADMAKLGENPDVFKPPKPSKFWDFISKQDEDDMNSLVHTAKTALGVELMNRPLFLMPGTWGKSN